MCNFEYPNPVDASPEAQAAATRFDAIFNRFFVEGMTKGRYPEALMDGFLPHLPKGWQDDFDVITAPLDWLGVNYYTRTTIKPDDSSWPSYTTVPGPLPKTAMDWEIYPDGLRSFLVWLAQEYTGDLPLYVTENGMAGHDELVDGAVDDQARIAYLTAHLDAVRTAIAGGAPVAGYFCWSLLDNYEWAFGYEKRFGLVHVDFDTLQRTPKASWHAMQRMLS